MAEHIINVQERLHEIDRNVMASLTPFQRATVEHIAQIYKDGQKRVLVADEVGLGKTLIARGVVSKIACLRSDEGDDLVKVAYICSNASIAAQNIEKLAIDGDINMAEADSSRLSMQHLKLAQERGDEELRRRYIQITPLTPATSFSIISGTGTMRERALILAALIYDERFSKESGRYERLAELMWSKRKDSNEGNWKYYCWQSQERVAAVHKREIESPDDCRYPNDILKQIESDLEGSGGTTFSSLCNYIDSGERDKHKEYRIINDLRRAFAKVSVDMLEPDFVIMDEFQRFRNLIADDDSETSLLAKRFLSGETRVLLLSATPFRMYSTDAELDAGGFGDSYHEFLEVMGFLGGDDEASHERFTKTWGDYAIQLRSLSTDACDIVSIRNAKGAAEQLARNYMARTERQSTGELGAIVDNQSHVRTDLEISAKDVQAFLKLRGLMRNAGIRRGLMSTDYVKSCPFPLSYMSDYKLFDELRRAVRRKPELINANKHSDGGLLWIRRWDLSYYSALPIGNARYKALMEDLAGDEKVRPEHMLWVPPSKPYYRPSSSSPFANADGFSKMILFSSWAMVPPAIATLLSYEFERKNVMKLRRTTGKNYRYFKDEEEGRDELSDAQSLPYRRMRFDREQHNAFLLMYPSRYLASLINVEELASQRMTIAEVRRMVKRRIANDLPEALGIDHLPTRGEAGQRSSIDWYVMAALKLDAWSGFDVLKEILEGEGRKALKLGSCYKTEEEILRKIACQADSWEPSDLGRFPEDLVDVLTDAAIGSPAVCALRTYGAYADDVPAWMGFQFGEAFVSRMNTASATLTLAAAMERSNDISSHWKNMLDYSCEGNLQAVLDEYAYMQRPVGLNLGKRAAAEYIHRSIVGPGDEPDLRVVEAVHGIRVPNSADEEKRIGQARMRTNIASAYMEAKSRSKGDAVVSRTNLREAFNSPFRPFVLVSTSIGQEGLDFHKYCRKVCHWNLPSNPIDLEQREGRVNRYQGLSVRQSIVARYGDMAFDKGPIWQQLFERAEQEELKREAGSESSGLLPYWGVSKGDDLVPVERYAYLYPFSKDVEQYESLVEQVYRYRMVIGQPEQEGLLLALQDRMEDGTLGEEELAALYVNLCPYVWNQKDAREDSSEAEEVPNE